MARTRRRFGVLATGFACAGIALAACSSPPSSPSGAAGSPTVASLSNTGANATSTTARGGGGTATTMPSTGNPTRLADEWAACMRAHGDPNQADPVIDAHGVINIDITTGPGGASMTLAEQIQGGMGQHSGPCSQYLNAAAEVLRAENPVSPPPNQSQLLKYVGCMRADGVPTYPYPTGDKVNFNGAGININSPTFIHANKVCGDQIGAPAWWTNGWGPPGDVSVTSHPAGVPSPPASPGTNG